MHNYWCMALLVAGQLAASVKDEKDLLTGIEHTTGDPIITVPITRDPFNWIETVTVKKIVPKKIIKKVPQLTWSVTGISATKRGLYALVGNGNETKLVQRDEQLGDWKITSISEQGILCKHATGCVRELRV